MPRPLTYNDDRERFARAGAASLTRIEGDLSEEKRFNYQVARQAEQDARAEARAVRMDKREDRDATSQNLDDELKRLHIESEKSKNDNAKLMLAESLRESKEANDELVKIKTSDEDADLKLADWEVKYYRVLDKKNGGDPRVIRQYEINQSRVEAAKAAKERKAGIEAAKAAGLAASSATIGGVTYSRPKEDKPDDSELKALERERKLYQDNLARAEGRRNSAKDEDTKKLFDADILEYKTKRDEAESQLRSFREGKAPPAPGAPAAPAASPAAPAKAVLPIVGEVRGGYRFKGGNPADKSNWEKI